MRDEFPNISLESVTNMLSPILVGHIRLFNRDGAVKGLSDENINALAKVRTMISGLATDISCGTCRVVMMQEINYFLKQKGFFNGST